MPKQPDIGLSELDSRKQEIRAQIKELEKLIHEAPEKLQRQREEELTTMPAPDELQEIHRERDFFDHLSRGQLKNEHRHQARSALLFVLLTLATLAISAWIWREVTAYTAG